MLDKTLQKNKNITFSTNSIAIDPSLLTIDSIALEKRKRQQIYSSLDAFYSNIGIFDFFSLDSFNLVLAAESLTKLLKKPSISTDALFFSFLTANLEVNNLLESSSVTKEKIGKIYKEYFNLEKQDTTTFFDNFRLNFQKIIGSKKGLTKKPVEYSYELKLLFEKAAENSLSRFKTPIVTPEILFLTLIENKKGNIAKLMKATITNDIEWYILRYKLIKYIHKYELCIKELRKNDHYFAYLFKKSISGMEFETVVRKNSLSEAICIFRNTMISKILPTSFCDFLELEINRSIRVKIPRKYDSRKQK